MPLRKLMEEQVFSGIRDELLHQIGLHADMDSPDELKQSFYRDHPLRFIDVNWKNFQIENHWYRNFQRNDQDGPVRGTVFQFTSDIYGDSLLIRFLMDNITRDLHDIFDLDWEYITLSLYVVLFGEDQDDPQKIALKRRQAVRKLKSAIEEINTEAALFKHELDLFIDEQVDLQAERVKKMKELYPTINKL